MFLVSGPALVKAACRAGVIGSFPTANCRTVEELDGWLADMGDDLARRRRDRPRAAPLCPNLIVHRSNPRVPDDLAAVLRHKAEMVITSVGSPEPVLKPLKDCGLPGAGRRGLGASCREGGGGRRRRAGAADGGRGRPDRLGQSLRLRARRAEILGRHRGDGGRHGRRPGDRRRRRRWAAISPTWAPSSSPRARAWPRTPTRQMLVKSRLDDVLLTRAFTGLETNMLRPSIAAAGLDPDDLPERGAIDIAKDINAAEREQAGRQALEGHLERRPLRVGRGRRAVGRRAGRADRGGIRRRAPLNAGGKGPRRNLNSAGLISCGVGHLHAVQPCRRDCVPRNRGTW